MKCLICDKEVFETDDQSYNRDGHLICSEECKDEYLDLDDLQLEFLLRKRR